jgi:hypothetical protein
VAVGWLDPDRLTTDMEVPTMADEKYKTDEAAALAAIKLALQIGRELSDEETVEFITKPVWLGYPEPLPAGKRGPRTRRTQYNAAADRRRGLYHRLVRLPANRPKAAKTRLRTGERLRLNVEKFAAVAIKKGCHAKRRKLLPLVRRAFRVNGLHIPSDRQLRRILTDLGYPSH